MQTILRHHESVDVYIRQFIYLYTTSHLQFPVDNYTYSIKLKYF